MDTSRYTNKLNQRLGEPQAYSMIRALGAEALNNLPWPSRKMEDWKYSPVSKLSGEFTPELENNSGETIEVNKVVKELEAQELLPIIVMGNKILHMAPALQNSIEILTLRQGLESGLIDSNSFSPVQSSLEALSLSLLDQGFVVRIKSGTHLSRPIYFMHLFSSKESKPLFQTRLHIDIESGANATWVEATSLNEAPVTCWLNYSLSVKAAPQSQFTLIQISELRETQQQTARLTCDVADGAQFHHLNVALSEGWHRNEIQVSCSGSEASVNLHGFGFGSKASVIDQQTLLTFKGPDNKSEQIYKNLLADKSRAIFNGSIKIEQPAQKTDASQLHQSILLSQEAEVDTKPELDIYADDVKATHGATIGQLNPDEIFYFQSRGIKAETAREILCMAFLLDLCDRIPQYQAKLYLKNRIEGFWKKVTQ